MSERLRREDQIENFHKKNDAMIKPNKIGITNYRKIGEDIIHANRIGGSNKIN